MPARSKFHHHPCKSNRIRRVESEEHESQQPPTRRQNIWSRVMNKRSIRIWPPKRKFACFVIAAMAYLRGPSAFLLGDKFNFDPNVAHAGVSVKISNLKVEATVKPGTTDLLMPIFPSPRQKKAAAAQPPPVSKPTTKAVVAAKNIPSKPAVVVKKVDKMAAVSKKRNSKQAVDKIGTKALSSQTISKAGAGVSIVLAVAGGILVAKVARDRDGGEDNDSATAVLERSLTEEGRKAQARSQQAVNYVKNALKQDLSMTKTVPKETEKLVTAGDDSLESLQPSLAQEANPQVEPKPGFLDELRVNDQNGGSGEGGTDNSYLDKITKTEPAAESSGR